MESQMPRGPWGGAKLKNYEQHATLGQPWLHLSRLPQCHKDGSETMTLLEQSQWSQKHPNTQITCDSKAKKCPHPQLTILFPACLTNSSLPMASNGPPLIGQGWLQKKSLLELFRHVLNNLLLFKDLKAQRYQVSGPLWFLSIFLALPKCL